MCKSPAPPCYSQAPRAASGTRSRARWRAARAELILTGRQTDVLEPLAAELGARALAVDLSDRVELERSLDDAGRVDILVANAALPASGRLESFSIEEIDRTLEVNLRAPIVLARALLPAMLERGSGHLLFVSSIAGKTTVVRRLDLQCHEVRSAGLHRRPARRPARQRRRRLMRVPGLHPRRRHVR